MIIFYSGQRAVSCDDLISEHIPCSHTRCKWLSLLLVLLLSLSYCRGHNLGLVVVVIIVVCVVVFVIRVVVVILVVIVAVAFLAFRIAVAGNAKPCHGYSDPEYLKISSQKVILVIFAVFAQCRCKTTNHAVYQFYG